MTDRHADLDAALEQVVTAAREHLAAVKAADGRIEDDQVWQSYVALNNFSFTYDELLMDTFGEVTPWDVEPIDPEEADEQYGVGLGGVDGGEAPDQQPVTVSVRQRRDYLVPSVAALLRVAEAARRAAPPGGAVEPDAPGAQDAGDAVADLLAAGDGSLGSLDIPELEPIAGVTVLCETEAPLDAEVFANAEADKLPSPFALSESDTAVRMIIEHPYAPEEAAEDGDDKSAG
ncbi:MAG: hypothetical protein GEU94_12105 [Micromonosporaceae bacterium]|nr:hypothetical protein [Micromonosporaceae bacterium]